MNDTLDSVFLIEREGVFLLFYMIGHMTFAWPMIKWAKAYHRELMNEITEISNSLFLYRKLTVFLYSAFSVFLNYMQMYVKLQKLSVINTIRQLQDDKKVKNHKIKVKSPYLNKLKSLLFYRYFLNYSLTFTYYKPV